MIGKVLSHYIIREKLGSGGIGDVYLAEDTKLDRKVALKVLPPELAKPTSGFVGGNADSAVPTAAKTAEGVIVGTLNYMSPEQAQGKIVDARSDIFSLGVVLYEMLTGWHSFQGETPASTLSAILKDTPSSVTEINSTLPGARLTVSTSFRGSPHLKV